MPKLRPATSDDLPLLCEMLIEAAFWRSSDVKPPADRELTDPFLERYVEGWPRDGEFGVVAEEGGHPLGAAWCRFFTAAEPGYGFVDEAVPELSVAVRPGSRRRGVGTAMLREILRQASDRNLERLSLSVERDNPSVSLYERLGFETRGSVGNAWTMVSVLEHAR